MSTKEVPLDRLTALVCAALAAGAAVMKPDEWRVAAGVLGGGLLVGISAWAIRGVVDGVLGPGGGRPAPAAVLVKFFTRHAILALTAYGMMLGLQLDPVGIVAGVSALWVAAAVEALRSNRR